MREYRGGKNIVVTDKASLVSMLAEVVEVLLERECRKEEMALMLATACVESDMRHRVQLGGGPAKGLFQMEPGMTGAQDIFVNYLAYQDTEKRQKLWSNLTKIWLGLDSVPYFTPTEEELAYHLEVNDPLGAALMRLKYKRIPDTLPISVIGMSKYWKQFYNTPAGKGTEQEFLDKWRYFGCNNLIRRRFESTIPMNG